jgi:hypothetical protein
MPGESTPAASEARRRSGYTRSSTEQSAGSSGAPRLGTEAGRAEGRDERSAYRIVQEAFTSVLKHAGPADARVLRLIAALAFVQTFLRGCATVLVVVVAIDLLGGEDADVGVLNAAIGLGALVGALLASTITWNGRHSRCLGVGVAHHRRRSARGGRRAAAFRRDRSRQRARRHRRLHAARTRGARRRDGTHVRNPRSALDVGVAFGAAVTSPVIALLGSRGALLAVGVVGPAAVAMAWPALRALDRRMARRDADIELLHQVALRRPLPQSMIEDLAASLERVVFAAGATVFEEGEAGESFYIVAAVHAELLRSDLPRTATVRAADDTILHVGVLARERFIAP